MRERLDHLTKPFDPNNPSAPVWDAFGNGLGLLGLFLLALAIWVPIIIAVRLLLGV
jgi:hypothetical protein